MNEKNLHKLIDKYEENLDVLNDADHQEYFKWQAVKQFQDIWFGTGTDSMPFNELLKAAFGESSVLIDNSTTHPATGAIKLAEAEPEEVKRLFSEVLFAEDGGNLDERLNNIYRFMTGMEEVRKKVYPESWKYMQNDKHAATTYLAMYKPDENYIYKYSVAEKFANHIEFGLDLGSGETFSLANYYSMCDAVVTALAEHGELIEKHNAYLDENCYNDESLHLLAFDIIYCCSAYNLFDGVEHISKKDALKKYANKQLEAKVEQRRQELITELEQKLEDLRLSIADAEEMSLVGIRVKHSKFGEGVVISQDQKKKSKVKVKFSEKEVAFEIDGKYSMRPIFEDDAEIVEMFTEYNRVWDEIKRNEGKLNGLINK